MKEIPATFGNATFLLLEKPKGGGKFQLLPIKEELQPRNPSSGQYVFGHKVRRLPNVKEIAHNKGVSLNEAKRLRDHFPFDCLIPPTDPAFWVVLVKERESKKKVA